MYNFWLERAIAYHQKSVFEEIFLSKAMKYKNKISFWGYKEEDEELSY